MAETKPARADDDKHVRNQRGEIVESTGRVLRTVEQTISEPLPPPTPTQEELDAILLGEPIEPPPEGETREQRQKREEEKRKQREAQPRADQQAGYQTR